MLQLESGSLIESLLSEHGKFEFGYSFPLEPANFRALQSICLGKEQKSKKSV